MFQRNTQIKIKQGFNLICDFGSSSHNSYRAVFSVQCRSRKSSHTHAYVYAHKYTKHTCTHRCVCAHTQNIHVHTCVYMHTQNTHTQNVHTTKYMCTHMCAYVRSGLCQDSLTELHALEFPYWSTRDNLVCVYQTCGLPWQLSGKQSACQCRRRGIPWVGKEMATYSSILAWEIPCTEEPGGLQSMGSQRVGRD